MHDFGKPWWGVAYVPCMTNLRALCAWAIRWHVTCMLSLAEHWQSRRALSNHVCAHSVISMWHVVCLQHLARACSEQSRSTTVLPINHVIQMPQCLSGFVNHDYCWSLRCSWSIACQRCSNYIFILHLTPGFSGLGKGNCKTRGETFKFRGLVHLILQVWQAIAWCDPNQKCSAQRIFPGNYKKHTEKYTQAC